MTTSGLTHSTRADLARVTETLGMITPRWSVWALMTLADQPLRYTEIKPRLPWLGDGQLHPTLRRLTDAGLVQRTARGPRHVIYGLTGRGNGLMPVLTSIAAWASTHLEHPDTASTRTGNQEPTSTWAAEARDVEDTLTLIAPRHATPILWTLKARGATSARSLASIVTPGQALSCIYPPLRRLVDDGLVDTVGGDLTFELSGQGVALGPAFAGMAAWAAGRPLAEARTHPLWGHGPAPSQLHQGWLTTQQRFPAPLARPSAAPWRPGDLFSHRIPARPAVPMAGGRSR